MSSSNAVLSKHGKVSQAPQQNLALRRTVMEKVYYCIEFCVAIQTLYEKFFFALDDVKAFIESLERCKSIYEWSVDVRRETGWRYSTVYVLIIQLLYACYFWSDILCLQSRKKVGLHLFLFLCSGLRYSVFEAKW